MNVRQFLYLLFWYITITIGLWIGIGGPVEWAFYATGILVVFIYVLINIIDPVFEFYDSLNDQSIGET